MWPVSCRAAGEGGEERPLARHRYRRQECSIAVAPEDNRPSGGQKGREVTLIREVDRLLL